MFTHKPSELPLSGSVNGISHSVLEMALSHLLDINRAIGASQYLPVPKTSLQLAHTFSSCPVVKNLLVHKQGSPLRYQDGTTPLFKPSTRDLSYV